MDVPHVIHQIWYQGQSNVPEKYIKWQTQWKLSHSQYEYILWEETMIKELLKNHYPWFYDSWMALPKMIQKIDTAKWFILHHQGGVYIDMDIESIKDITPLLDRSIVFAQMDFTKIEAISLKLFGLSYIYKWRFNNAFIACAPKHPVMEFLIHNLKYHIHEKSIIHKVEVAKTVGPERLCEAFNKTINDGYTYLILEPNKIETKSQENYAIHHSDEAWNATYVETRSGLNAITIIFIILLLLICLVIMYYVYRRSYKKGY